MKKWSYHTSFDVEFKDGTKLSMQSQLYQVGVYCILNNDSRTQGGCTPSSMVIRERKLKKDPNVIKLEFGTLITVATVDGLFKKLE